jgi:hypothetical protein
VRPQHRLRGQLRGYDVVVVGDAVATATANQETALTVANSTVAKVLSTEDVVRYMERDFVPSRAPITPTGASLADPENGRPDSAAGVSRSSVEAPAPPGRVPGYLEQCHARYTDDVEARAAERGFSSAVDFLQTFTGLSSRFDLGGAPVLWPWTYDVPRVPPRPGAAPAYGSDACSSRARCASCRSWYVRGVRRAA